MAGGQSSAIGCSAIQFIQLTIYLIAQACQFPGSLAQPIDYFLRRFRQELFIAELALIVGEFLLDLIQFFGQALAFAGNIDLFLIDDAGVEAGGMQTISSSRQSKRTSPLSWPLIIGSMQSARDREVAGA